VRAGSATMNDNIFSVLKKILKANSRGLELKSTTINSQAKIQKPALHLYGKKKISFANRRAKQTYVVGIVKQKSYVGFYFMPIYSHPNKFLREISELKKLQRGKACYHIRGLSDNLKDEINKIVKEGIKIYRQEKWI